MTVENISSVAVATSSHPEEPKSTHLLLRAAFGILAIKWSILAAFAVYYSWHRNPWSAASSALWTGAIVVVLAKVALRSAELDRLRSRWEASPFVRGMSGREMAFTLLVGVGGYLMLRVLPDPFKSILLIVAFLVFFIGFPIFGNRRAGKPSGAEPPENS